MLASKLRLDSVSLINIWLSFSNEKASLFRKPKMVIDSWLATGPAIFTHRFLKYSCTNATAMAASPTAEVTRFIEPERTSPAAKTPDRLVSRKWGWRCAVQKGEFVTAAPVLMKPS